MIAIREQNPQLEVKMTQLIQQSYYLDAQNPSETDTLIALADQLDIDIKNFGKNLNSEKTQLLLLEDIALMHSLGVNSFPSLVLKTKSTLKPISIDYNNANTIISQILA